MIYNVKKNFIALIGIVFCFIPFFSLLPLSSDLQLMHLLVIVFLLFIDKRMHSFSKFELLFLLFSICSIFYIDANQLILSFEYIIIFFFSFLTFHFARVYFGIFNQKHLFIILIINSFAILFHWLDAELFSRIFSYFLRVIKVNSAENLRGYSGLAPEPGFMGALGVFYFSIAIFLNDYKKQKKFFIVNLILSLCIILLTQSGTGYLYLIIFLFLYFVQFNLKKISIGLILILLFLLFLKYFDLGRGSYILSSIIADPMNFFFQDQSTSHRITSVLIGIFSTIENPLGHGLGSWEVVANDIVLKYDIFEKISNVHLGNTSAFAKYSVEFGLSFWFFLLYFIIFGIINKKIAFMFLALLFILVSFTIAFPPTWILLAIVMYNDQIINFEKYNNN